MSGDVELENGQGSALISKFDQFFSHCRMMKVLLTEDENCVELIVRSKLRLLLDSESGVGAAYAVVADLASHGVMAVPDSVLVIFPSVAPARPLNAPSSRRHAIERELCVSSASHHR